MGKYIHGTSASEQKRLADLNEATNARFRSYLDGHGVQRVLELGSGLGLLTREVADSLPSAHVVGIEFSAQQLARAPQGVPNLEFRQGDVHALPFEDGTFEIVYARYVLEHVREPAQVLREAHRVLAPGGRIVLQENDISLTRLDPPVPAFDAVWRAFARLQARLGGDPHIGTKLYRLLFEASFERISLASEPELHSHGTPAFDAWISNLEEQIVSSRDELVSDPRVSVELLCAAQKELARLRDDQRASAVFHWNRAQGIKPRSTR